jgi:glycosyltransferase involved in cell wall biosynthesis
VRLAFVSPLPPAPSGIADYAAELLPHLAARPEIEAIELYVPPGLPAPAAALAAAFEVRPWRQLVPRGRGGDFDLALYQLGNHPRFHGAIWAALDELPGVVMLHEHVLHHMVREVTLTAGDAAGYVEEMRYAYGAAGRSLARRAVATGVSVDAYAYPLFERAVDRSRGVLVHNRACAERVLASRPEARVAVVPHHLHLGDGAAGSDPEAAKLAARRRLGLPADALLVGTFGYQNRSKRLDSLLAAFAVLRGRHPGARLAVVGGVDPKLGVEAAEGVDLVGRVDDFDRFLDWMRAVDVAVNLRWPSGGETSGTVIRLLGLGKPLAVTDAGSFAEIPAGCAAHVPADESERERLAALLVALAGDPALAGDLGAAARDFARTAHAPEVAAAGYARFLAAVAADSSLPRRPVPPLAPWPQDDLYTALVATVAAAAADLGVEAADEEVLAPLAAAFVDLGLDAIGGEGGER